MNTVGEVVIPRTHAEIFSHPPDSQAQTSTLPRGQCSSQFGSNRSSVHFVTSASSSESPTTISTTPIAPNEFLSHEEVKVFRRVMAQLDHSPDALIPLFAHSGISTSVLNASFYAPSRS